MEAINPPELPSAKPILSGSILATNDPAIVSGTVPEVKVVVNPAFVREKSFSNNNGAFNLADKPDHYVGKRRKKDQGEDTKLNIESENPTVFLVIEKVEGLGDSVIAASMSFKTAVRAVQEFARGIEGEIFPERSYLPSAGTVRMRKSDDTITPYRIDPVALA